LAFFQLKPNERSEGMNDRFFERAGSLAIIAVLVIASLKVIAPLPGALLWGAIIAIST